MSPNQQRNRNTGLWMTADFVVILAAYSLVFLGRAATAPIFYGDALPFITKTVKRPSKLDPAVKPVTASRHF